MHAVCQIAVLQWCELMPAACLTAGQTAERHSQDVGETPEEVAAKLQQIDAVRKHAEGQPSNQQQEGNCAEHSEVPGSIALLLRPAAATQSAVEQEAALCSAAVTLGKVQASVEHSQDPGSGSSCDGGTLAAQGEMCRDVAGSSGAVAAWLQDAAGCEVEARYSLGRQACCFPAASAGGIA